jgi:hypothetical protein
MDVYDFGISDSPAEGGQAMKRKALVLGVVIILASVPMIGIVGKEPSKKEADVKELMQQKLKHSQKVLEAIAIGNFDGIAKHAEELINLSKEAEWKVIKTPRFETYSNDFQRNAEALVKGAKDKNIDAAALAYVDLTLNCVKCHKYVREVRMTRGFQVQESTELARGPGSN